jgi:hypothetical protein
VSFVLYNPIRYIDPTGHWVETAWDIANIAWDIYEVKKDASVLNIGALVIDVAAAVLPFVPAGAGLVVRGGKAAKATVEAVTHADDIVDAAKAIDTVVDAGKEIETAGQLHHIFSTKIMDAVKDNQTLSKIFSRDSMLVQAFDKASHNGYQEWHRVYDQTVVDWIKKNPDASAKKFLEMMQDLYKQSDMEKRFPDAWKLIQMAIEELE